jgi:hypothetical protein
VTLHNVTRSISVPVNRANRREQIERDKTVPVKQTDDWFKPVSGGSVVSVKGTVNISVTIVGR